MCADFHYSKFISRQDKTLSNAAGKMGNDPFALNVHAGEVSCRAGTIKCPRRYAPQAPSVPQRDPDISVSPLIAPKCVIWQTNSTNLDIQRHKARSACLQNASQPAVSSSILSPPSMLSEMPQQKQKDGHLQ